MTFGIAAKEKAVVLAAFFVLPFLSEVRWKKILNSIQ